MSEMNMEFLKKLLSGEYNTENDEPEVLDNQSVILQPESESSEAHIPILKQNTELVELPIVLLEDYPDNPIPPYKDKEMTELVNSIRTNGIIEPLLVRPYGKKYQIINGRNRRNGALLLGYDSVPCIVRDMGDDDAVIQLAETIFTQRNVSRISVMQKARAYRLWIEALKRQGRRTDLTSSPVGMKMQTLDIVGQEVGESRNQIHRYIRLTYLIPELQDIVDKDKPEFPFRAAVLISFLSEPNQTAVYRFFLTDHDYGISMKLAELLRVQEQAGDVFDEDMLSKLWESLNGPKSDEVVVDEPEDVVLPYKKFRQFFPPRCSADKIEAIMLKALKMYHKAEQRKEANRHA